MRIIAGQFRGRRLKAIPGTTTRPTSDKLRETLFNILVPWIEGAVFIDAYAGTGAVGIEALSRGAGRVFLIESDQAAAELIEQNLSWLLSQDPIRILRGRAGAILPRLASENVCADICFLDPPYAELQEALALLDEVADNKLMNSSGWIILEHSRRDATPEAIGKQAHLWKRSRLLIQGDSALSFYRREA